MPQSIALVSTPSQSLTCLLEGSYYALTIRTLDSGDTVASVTINNVLIVDNVRVVANRQLMPHIYQEGDGGNFLLQTANDALPDWTEFGTSQTLLYFTAAELATIRAADPT